MDAVNAAERDPGYTLDVGPYRYAVTHRDTSVHVQCEHLLSGVVAEHEGPDQHDARMAARQRVDQIRSEERP